MSVVIDVTTTVQEVAITADTTVQEAAITASTTVQEVAVTVSSGEPATAVLKNTLNETISTTSIESGATSNITAPDATAVLKDTAGNTLLTEGIPSNGSENITAPNSTVLLNGAAFQTPRSGQSIGVTTVTVDGVAVAVTNTGTQINVPYFSARLLDTYEGADFAYSLRLLRAAYYGRPCIRVRRSGDNSEFDFGFTTAGVVDTASIVAFCIAGGGTQNGLVVTWYDQSGNSRHVTNATGAQQPSICLGGVINLEASKPTVSATGGQSLLYILPGATPTYGQPATIWAVAKSTGSGSGILGGSSGSRLGMLAGSSTAWSIVSNAVLSSGITSTSRSLAYALFNGSSLSIIALNGAAGTTGNAGSAGTVQIRLFNDAGGGAMTGNIQEVICYFSLQSSNKSAIETNINTYYAIY